MLKFFLASTFVVLIVLCSCTSEKESSARSDAKAGTLNLIKAQPIVISAKEAERLITDASSDGSKDELVVLDCRPMKDAEASRVKGSRVIDVSAVMSRFNDPLTGPTHPEAWQSFFADNGIRFTTRTLIVDGGKLVSAASIWSVVQRLGFQNASVVNGGYDRVKQGLSAEWIVSGPIETGPLAVDHPYQPIDRALRVGYATKADVLEDIRSKERKVLDVRSIDEWRGVETRNNPRVGHIPTAKLIPHTELFSADGLLLPPDALRQKFEAAGFMPGDAITTHCQGGGRAAFVAMALAYAGYDNIENYYGSFGEWSKDAACPVEAP